MIKLTKKSSGSLPEDIKNTHQLANLLLSLPVATMEASCDCETSAVSAPVAKYENDDQFGGLATLAVSFSCYLNG
jgi:hypothetical protein